jgi:hypothetical protein
LNPEARYTYTLTCSFYSIRNDICKRCRDSLSDRVSNAKRNGDWSASCGTGGSIYRQVYKGCSITNFRYPDLDSFDNKPSTGKNGTSYYKSRKEKCNLPAYVDGWRAKEMISPGLEPGTTSVLDLCDNQLHHETIDLGVTSKLFKHFSRSNDNNKISPAANPGFALT